MVDTLQIDTAAVSAWRSNSDYDYEREMVRSGDSLWDRLNDALGKAFQGLFGNTFDDIPSWSIWVIIGLLVLIVVIILIAVYRPSVFFRNGRGSRKYSVTEDNIYGIDFDKGIAKAVAKENWREAVRLTYLRQLRLLSDNKLIDWQIFKTPTQYTQEFRNNDFQRFSNLFLRVRYGGFKAVENDYKTAVDLAGNISEAVWKLKKEKNTEPVNGKENGKGNEKGGAL